MITPDYARTMARYNQWQNTSLYGAAGMVSDEDRRRDRGAFFRSIHGTLSHLFWGDSIWFSRFSDWPKPPGGIRESADFQQDWAELTARRQALDAAIVAWADALAPEWLSGDLIWYSALIGREMRRPRALLLVHFFNHQTHHRGQTHAMLTAAGARPDDTDLMIMPGL